MKKQQPTHTFTVKGLKQSTRLDRILREHFPTIGRRKSQNLINAKKVKVNQKVVWICSWQVNNGDSVTINGEIKLEADKPADFNEKWIIKKEKDLIAINKPTGILSHKTQTGGVNDILSMAMAHFGQVFLFHRLDRDTSGMMLFTYPGEINRYLDKAFKEATIKKEYLAVVTAPNNLEERGEVKTRMSTLPNRRDKMMVAERGGKAAHTEYEVIAEAEGKQLVRLWPLTGRTHQLRVHMAHMNAPIFGDRIYAPRYLKANRMLLHAHSITLPEEGGFKERKFVAPVPEDFMKTLPEALKKAIRKLQS